MATQFADHEYWADGHYIVANSEDEARHEVAALYDNHYAEVVRPWTADDQAELDFQTGTYDD